MPRSSMGWSHLPRSVSGSFGAWDVASEVGWFGSFDKAFTDSVALGGPSPASAIVCASVGVAAFDLSVVVSSLACR